MQRPRSTPAPAATLLALSLAATLSHATLAAPAPLRYEGVLRDAGRLADGRYDLQLTPFSARVQGKALAEPTTFPGVEVREGRFRLELELELAAGAETWLQLGVRGAGEGGDFLLLPQRTKATSASLIGPYWSTSGDAGSDSAVHFLGTTDAQPLELRVQNQRVMRFEPSGILFEGAPITANVIAGSAANAVSIGVRGATIAGGGVPGGDSDPVFEFEAPNRVTDAYGTVGGGFGNRAGDEAGLTTDAPFATVGGGQNNTASGESSVVGGGENNVAAGVASAVVGGSGNLAGAGLAFVGGGSDNQATGEYAAIAGGNSNLASAGSSAIGGGSHNTASETWASVGGGIGNSATEQASAVGGGMANLAAGQNSSVAGGQNNTASGPGSSVSGGLLNTASGYYAAIMGGEENTASGSGSSVGGGSFNLASGDNSTVAGGMNNAAVGHASTVAGGVNNCAGGNNSWAGGRNARVRLGTNVGAVGAACEGAPVSGVEGDAGTFVWADSQDVPFTSSGPNQFLIRAAGGVGINTNDPAGNALRVVGTVRLDTLGTAGSTNLCRNASNQIATCSSSARYKRDIHDLELGLDALAKLRPVSYVWKDSGVADIGFVAEEVAEVDPRLVEYDAEGRVEGVRYDRLSALLAVALREQRAEAERELETLRSELLALQAQTDATLAALRLRAAPALATGAR